MPQCDLFTVENAMAIGETMPNYYTMSDCQAHMGVWGMFSKNVDGGTNSVTCEIEGEVSVAGVSIKGSYRKGKSYTISWSRYSCEKAEGSVGTPYCISFVRKQPRVLCISCLYALSPPQK